MLSLHNAQHKKLKTTCTNIYIYKYTLYGMFGLDIFQCVENRLRYTTYMQYTYKKAIEDDILLKIVLLFFFQYNQ